MRYAKQSILMAIRLFANPGLGDPLQRGADTLAVQVANSHLCGSWPPASRSANAAAMRTSRPRTLDPSLPTACDPRRTERRPPEDDPSDTKLPGDEPRGSGEVVSGREPAALAAPCDRHHGINAAVSGGFGSASRCSSVVDMLRLLSTCSGGDEHYLRSRRSRSPELHHRDFAPEMI